MWTAQLRGRDHLRLGRVSAVAEGDAAIAISRGGAKKPYAYRDPNEDAALFIEGAGQFLLAVADGHSGHEAAEWVIDRIAQVHASPLLSATEDQAQWTGAARALVIDLQDDVLKRQPTSPEVARTTLSLAVVRPAADVVAWANMGDSHVFRVGADGVEELGPAGDGVVYLGSAGADADAIAGGLRAGVAPLGATRAIVLASDGLSEQGIGVADPAAAAAAAVTRASTAKPALRALEAARGLAEQALAAHHRQRAGDNIVTAVAWLG